MSAPDASISEAAQCLRPWKPIAGNSSPGPFRSYRRSPPALGEPGRSGQCGMSRSRTGPGGDRSPSRDADGAAGHRRDASAGSAYPRAHRPPSSPVPPAEVPLDADGLRGKH
jgi:hypothetical protein